MKLFYRQKGTGQPLIILHGLLGSSDNWHTLAGVLSSHFSVYMVDQRNHGRSPHSATFNYSLLVKDLQQFIAEQRLARPIILGHSMGGKTAMNFALTAPNLLSHLIVVDMTPNRTKIDYQYLIDAMQKLPLSMFQTRSEVDHYLSSDVSDDNIRLFLLKNLYRNDLQQFCWRPNLKALSEHIDEVGVKLYAQGSCNTHTLFIRGTQSNYITEQDKKEIVNRFPLAKIADVTAGHWIHAENPKDFLRLLSSFLNVSLA